ncbi:MAG TPA: electron transfer flavoprotein subunit beta/FixA family protein [Syntrophorhabdaceae bacterium]|nr:electron transfer flavoprotein subunit beta/FixA family protein [Syntrophorhabdaceae bacterium]HOL06240.1 electron transfer flavoprotein subunit beta/FixA family protein [Syntrophorhabdaceae bacterium]HON84701.1 electron transfer flavoprotein subunit beta/FixA family protein [Syntrophorhabdaceae bacterium]HOT41338.1 electron transfer flavoprotein subunit beta/FixA family protein [Syntrophorhabdaceae bacterium]HPC66684.1 electron transfer flavoprotein subunit beta/FixA family protein [Syntrop
MHIVVCVKMVPDTTQVKIDPVTNTLIREGVPFITNPFDGPAVEEALKIKDKHGGKITVLSMGPPMADSVIRKAIAMGADDGILLSDRVFGGADTLATSKVLAHAILEVSKKDPVDIIICGKQTIDGDTAQVGPGIATRLGFSQATLVDKIISLDLERKKIVVRRKQDEWHEVIEVSLPTLLTVERDANRPRYPSVPRRIYSEEISIPIWNNYFMQLDPKTIGLNGSATTVKRIFAPEKQQGEIYSGDGDGNGTGKLVSVILKKFEEWKIRGAQYG